MTVGYMSVTADTIGFDTNFFSCWTSPRFVGSWSLTWGTRFSLLRAGTTASGLGPGLGASLAGASFFFSFVDFGFSLADLASFGFSFVDWGFSSFLGAGVADWLVFLSSGLALDWFCCCFESVWNWKKWSIIHGKSEKKTRQNAHQKSLHQQNPPYPSLNQRQKLTYLFLFSSTSIYYNNS